MKQELLPIPYQTHSLQFQQIAVNIIEPDSTALKAWYEEQTAATPFPYWGKIWPSAIALSTFIAEHPDFISNKKVIEIAGGLGLPSLVAAQIADTVICTDHIQLPLDYFKNSARLNNLSNTQTAIFDWKQPKTVMEYDTILMSDVNYNPDDFPYLFSFIETLQKQHKTLLLSTPKRLAGKDFINQIIPFAKQQIELEITSLQTQEISGIIVLII